MRKNNEGYTLIELIIVIAIMAILSGVSFVTIGIIKKAQYNAAASTLSNQMGALLVKTKAISEAKDQRLCMLVHRNNTLDDSDYPLTLNDGTVIRKNSYSLILGYHDGSDFIVKSTGAAFSESDLDTVVEDVLPNIITIDYATKDTTACSIAGLDTSDNLIIEYNKSTGGVRYGSGDYKIIYNERTVATVKLDAVTGNHYLK